MKPQEFGAMLRDHLKKFDNFEKALTLRAHEETCVDFIRSCLPQGPSAQLHGAVMMAGWETVAALIFDAP